MKTVRCRIGVDEVKRQGERIVGQAKLILDRVADDVAQVASRSNALIDLIDLCQRIGATGGRLAAGRLVDRSNGVSQSDDRSDQFARGDECQFLLCFVTRILFFQRTRIDAQSSTTTADQLLDFPRAGERDDERPATFSRDVLDHPGAVRVDQRVFQFHRRGLLSNLGTNDGSSWSDSVSVVAERQHMIRCHVGFEGSNQIGNRCVLRGRTGKPIKQQFQFSNLRFQRLDIRSRQYVFGSRRQTIDDIQYVIGRFVDHRDRRIQTIDVAVSQHLDDLLNDPSHVFE
ncbi:hypothetical protein Pla52n_68660 [Stieleria varia]|uniref:Uncharacterized protein n=1 Tax=Stieleria varia TaxID=2528005 RepID=A0A5C5ZP02_9BACT|nr:hypothetical protein Pla52n_68660 [Stieleria varia]